MPRYRTRFWNRAFLLELGAAIMLLAGGAGFWTAPFWAGRLAVLIFR
jgi:hypothetical protein